MSGGALTPDEIARRFHDRTLPKAHWTHEAHLIVCWHVLRGRDPAAALDHLRVAIRAYNDQVGTPNTDTSGYHETLTGYYVAAVAALGAVSVDEVLGAPSCARDAPGRYWSRERLFSVAARREWCAPDRAPLPWGTGGDEPRRTDPDRSSSTST